ncbi:putative Dihydroneopterin aldolase [Roseovarius sp. EC-HK134]|mgnify:FL=1|uniref:dihydroneopterin aldolase n=1 Tax=Roseovarius mucosus TaxID=215743 RepID=A0A1V0RSQ9_9RHOB|nr:MULTISPECIES: dihydroneopterin aldolase [Roseovarius]ARE84820.1 bifunctional dihydroneopterin aldolase/dihydroneopterin triphosphate 2'-epimerase [Roseovarius mucosus]AWZ20960.1 Dihydroneopterin aldolase [Roseovarius sp. AK1035]EDM32837.1 dihydroneopterin aldolase, putative [Roseovarius sp. TM1035]MBW4975730.1 dihydroneopterin aldolase [Roseovarius mucosus]VVT21682.1 putative Dihydroneopterin aldolase [Roseovarius sp. EC-SD190]
MTHEIRLAFEHPSARARATSPDGPLDRISVRDHVVEVEIGAFQAERGTTQRICFNVVVEVRPLTDAIEDDVDRILSYDKVTEAIAAELAEERLNLLETLAERIAERILWEPQAVRTFVRIEKLDRGPGALGVEIVRSVNDLKTKPITPHAATTPHPHVVFLTNTAIRSPNLSRWLDQLEARAEPVILCVGRADEVPPQTGHRMTQRRVDLLAMEQNAWVLAGRDERCVVVATRTELDWSMKHGQISVWAPSKIVLDAVDGPGVATDDPVALAAWFAGYIEASDLLMIGETPPKSCRVPVLFQDVAQSGL